MAKDRGSDRVDEDLVRQYLRDIGQHALLSKDDEIRLAQHMEAGKEARALLEMGAITNPTERGAMRRAVRRGDDAERAFVLANLRLVVSIAKRYQASGVPLLDLVQEGNLGLIHAVEKFDWRKGFKFSTYATWWIRQAITRGIANTGRTIRLPVHAGDLLTRVQRTRSRIEATLGRPPTIRELATELDLPTAKVTEALLFAADPVSLSEPLRDEGDAELGDMISDAEANSPFEEIAALLLPGEVELLLARLDERERLVIRLRYGLDRGEPRTLDDVGRAFDLTRERIRQIESRALAKLRHPAIEAAARDLLAG